MEIVGLVGAEIEQGFLTPRTSFGMTCFFAKGRVDPGENPQPWNAKSAEPGKAKTKGFRTSRTPLAMTVFLCTGSCEVWVGFVGFVCFAVLGGLATLCVIRVGWLGLGCKSGGEPLQFKYEYTGI